MSLLKEKHIKQDISLDFGVTEEYRDSEVPVPVQSNYFSFEVDAKSSYEEMNDKDLIKLAKSSKAFKFLDDPEEDIYTPNDGKPL